MTRRGCQPGFDHRAAACGDQAYRRWARPVGLHDARGRCSDYGTSPIHRKSNARRTAVRRGRSYVQHDRKCRAERVIMHPSAIMPTDLAGGQCSLVLPARQRGPRELRGPLPADPLHLRFPAPVAGLPGDGLVAAEQRHDLWDGQPPAGLALDHADGVVAVAERWVVDVLLEPSLNRQARAG